MIFESEDNWNAKSNNTSRKHSISILSPTTSSIESIGHNPNNNISSSAINRMTNHSKFDNLSSEYNPSHNRWSPEHFNNNNNNNNKASNSNRHTANKYLTINPYYNMEDSNASSSETKIQILKSIDNDGVGSGFTSCTSGNIGQIGVISTNINNNDNNNNNAIANPVTNNTSNSNNNNFDIDCFHYPLREAMNQDLIDLLRSQISKLLEENEKLVSRIDDYRQKIAFIEREKREAAVDPSNELLTLQTELGEARMREAELTISFEELQHRITAIDRLIETDPEMENFFNAVTISPTSLSLKKQSQIVNSSQISSPAKYANYQSTQNNLSDMEDQRILHEIRSSPFSTEENNSQKLASPSINKSMYSRVSNSSNNNNSYTSRIYSRLQNEQYSNNFNNDIDSEFPRGIQQSGLDSPQSDSGCSLASHTTSDGKDGKDVTNAFGRVTAGVENYDNSNNRLNVRRLTQPHYNFQIEANNKTISPSRRDRSRGGDEDEDFDSESKNNRPKGFVSLLRRSRSSAADHVMMNGFRSELNSPCSNDTINHNRASIDTPTPTESGASGPEQYEICGNERKPGDRLSRLRASLRQSFGWPLSKPDFRMEAFAARQGEARALLKLRETRMDVLRVQSRCQTLQRHIDRLEAINSFRMSELEDAVANDRELRQEIRNLQTRIFQLEAEHREFKVGQRIKEMELMSKLAESNMRLSHAEMSNQQAIVWSQLNKAHEAAVDLLTPAHSQTSLISPCMLTMESPSTSRYTIANNNNSTNNNNNNTGCKEDGMDICRSKNNFPSISRYGDLRRDVSGRKTDLSKTTIFTEFTDGQHNTNYDSINDRRLMRSESNSSSTQRNHHRQHSSNSRRDKSIDSLSELRLMPEISIIGKSSDVNR